MVARHGASGLGFRVWAVFVICGRLEVWAPNMGPSALSSKAITGGELSGRDLT